MLQDNHFVSITNPFAEVSQTFVFALEMQNLLHPFHLINYQFRLDCLELILLSAATALTAVCRTAELLQSSPLADQCCKMLLGLSDVLEHNQRYTRRGANRPTSWIQRLSKRQLQSAVARRQISLRSISPAIVKLSHCLVYLRQTDALPEILAHGRGLYGRDISVSSLRVAMLNAFPLSELGLRPMRLEANEHFPNPGNSDFRGSSQSRVNNDADTTYRETLPILPTTDVSGISINRVRASNEPLCVGPLTRELGGGFCGCIVGNDIRVYHGSAVGHTA